MKVYFLYLSFSTHSGGRKEMNKSKSLSIKLGVCVKREKPCSDF